MRSPRTVRMETGGDVKARYEYQLTAESYEAGQGARGQGLQRGLPRVLRSRVFDAGAITSRAAGSRGRSGAGGSQGERPCTTQGGGARHGQGDHREA